MLDFRHACLIAICCASIFTTACQQDQDEPVTDPSEDSPIQETPDVSIAPRPDRPEHSLRGAHQVGHRVFDFPASGGRAMTIKAWYPADADASDAGITYKFDLKETSWVESVPAPSVDGGAIRDAALTQSGAPRPVILFSHGYGMNPEWYSELLEHYASHGFVVFAPEHLESDWFEAHATALVRPADVSLAIDHIESLAASGDWSGQLDADNVAVVGHSYGGYAALAAAGARFDLDPFMAECAGIPMEDPRAFICAPYFGKEAQMAEAAGLASPPEGLWPSMGDPRVSAIVPIAGDAYLFGEQGMKSVEVPMMAIGGTADFGTPWSWGAQMAFDHTSSTSRALVGLDGGSHFIPTNTCAQMSWVHDLGDVGAFACYDPVWDRQRALDLVAHFSTAFLKHTMLRDETARAALSPAAVWFPGITFDSEL